MNKCKWEHSLYSIPSIYKKTSKNLDNQISIMNRECRKILCLLFPFFIIFKQMWRYIHDNTKFWTPLSKVFTSTLSLYRSVYKTISYSPIDSYLHLTIQQILNGDQINICSIKMITGKGRGPGTLRGSASVSKRGNRFPSQPMASFEWDGRVALIVNGAVRTQTEAVSVLWGQVPLETSSQSHAKLDMTSSITG